MRTRALAIGFGALLTVIATTVVYADFRKGDYSPAQLGNLLQQAPNVISTDSTYRVPSYPVPAVDLVAGDGVQEVRIYCNTCHTPRYITMQPPLPAATWEAEVNKMNKAFGADIPDDSTKKIIAYLGAHYSVGNRKQ